MAENQAYLNEPPIVPAGSATGQYTRQMALDIAVRLHAHGMVAGLGEETPERVILSAKRFESYLKEGT